MQRHLADSAAYLSGAHEATKANRQAQPRMARNYLARGFGRDPPAVSPHRHTAGDPSAHPIPEHGAVAERPARRAAGWNSLGNRRHGERLWRTAHRLGLDSADPR